jgi:polyisoprenoid-binding protein YceI
VLVGDLTIKDVTRPVEIEVERDGIVTDPFGNTRAGFEGEAEISRKDFGLTWNVPLDAGGVLVSDKIKIQLDVSATKNA